MAVEEWVKAGKALRANWEKTTPAALVQLIDNTVKTATAFAALREKLPKIAEDAQKKAEGIVDKHLTDIGEQERDIILKSDEALALRSNLEGYYRDFRAGTELIGRVATTLSSAELTPVAELPPTPVSVKVPVEDIKDTFLNLEFTPRIAGDVITVRATLSDGTKVVDTTTASFQVERYGYYAELSPAVVLIKPAQLKGGNDGFRFAPVLSWMHHWAPRPEDSCKLAKVFRSLDPAVGINSAFTNFSSSSSNDTIQIGLGITLSLWRNRLQSGAGYNLMANSKDEGQYYYFIGSDLIGLLQTIGLVRE